MPWSPSYPGEVPSLGWRLLDWLGDVLPSPRDETQPLVLTDEQARDLVDWYSLDPQGRFVHRRGCQMGAKGTGKSPAAGILALADLAGDVVFDGWDAAGQPVGRPWGTKGSPPPMFQVAAVSEDQSQNTYGALLQLLHANGARAADTLRIDAGYTRCILRDRPGALEPVTASAGSREGQPLTGAVLDETHLWTQRNGGVRLARTLRRNVAKMGGRTWETTNAPELGEGSVAEQTLADAAEGKAGILLIARRPVMEPQPDWPADRKLAALEEAYGGAWWVDRHRLLAEMADMPWPDVVRFFYNIPSAGAARAVDPRLWEQRKVPGEPPGSGARIGLGFDGSVSRDETYLVGCTAAGWTWPVERWARPEGAPRDWTVPRLDVEAAMARAFERWDVGQLIYDPPFWRTEGEGWERRWPGRVVALDTNQPRRFAPAVERWRSAIETGAHTHSGDPDITRHVLEARLRKVHLTQDDEDGRTRYVLVKGSSGDRIDGAVATVLAYEAAMTMAEAPQPVEVRFFG